MGDECDHRRPPLVRRRGRPRNDVTREATRRRILDAAREEFSSARATTRRRSTMSSAPPGLSKGGFYFHFPSKDAVFEVLPRRARRGPVRPRPRRSRAGRPSPSTAWRRACGRSCEAATSSSWSRLVFAHPGGTHELLERKRDRGHRSVRVAGPGEPGRGPQAAEPVPPGQHAHPGPGPGRRLHRARVRGRALPVPSSDVEEVADVLVDLLCCMALSARVVVDATLTAPSVRSKGANHDALRIRTTSGQRRRRLRPPRRPQAGAGDRPEHRRDPPLPRRAG